MLTFFLASRINQYGLRINSELTRHCGQVIHQYPTTCCRQVSMINYIDKNTSFNWLGAEYWIIQPYELTLLIYTLIDGKYIASKLFTVGDIVASKCISGFKLDLEEVFSNLD